MTQPGLNLIAPDLVELLHGADEAGRRRAAAVACQLALERTGLSDARVSQARSALAAGRIGDVPERRGIQELTQQLDEAAWDARDRVRSGAATDDEYRRAFARARAAAALASAFEVDALQAALETLYEAHFAMEDLEALKAAVTKSLR